MAFIHRFNLVLVWSKIVQILTKKSPKWVRHYQVSWSSFNSNNNFICHIMFIGNGFFCFFMVFLVFRVLLVVMRFVVVMSFLVVRYFWWSWYFLVVMVFLVAMVFLVVIFSSGFLGCWGRGWYLRAKISQDQRLWPFAEPGNRPTYYIATLYNILSDNR